MKKGKLGFTLVEVALFLAITAVLFVGVTVGVQNSINNQRYTDSVQSFMEFLRGVYAEVLNVQNQTTGGKSNHAIYGKLVTFGESTDLSGNNTDSTNAVFAYTVVGDDSKIIPSSSDRSALGVLVAGRADVTEIASDNGISTLKLSGFPESYIPKWGTHIEVPCSGPNNCPNNLLRGMLLIVRHPLSGVVYTYFSSTDSNDPRATYQINNRFRAAQNGESISVLDLNTAGFNDNADVNFCVRPSVDSGNTQRSDVRIKANARNASAIELIDREGSDNVCDRK